MNDGQIVNEKELREMTKKRQSDWSPTMSFSFLLCGYATSQD
jgi:hypothetical protein